MGIPYRCFKVPAHLSLGHCHHELWCVIYSSQVSRHRPCQRRGSGTGL